MSEYQYYEFVAVDGPISEEGLRYARAASTRAEVSRFRWKNVYHYGSFHGSDETLLQYYDAHFYTANWGTVRLGLGLPGTSLPPAAIQPYLRGGERYEHTLTCNRVGSRCIVWWERNEEGGWLPEQGDGSLDQLVGIREEILRGDYRALFLGWLADFDPTEWKDARDAAPVMPPIPPGLDRLSPALTALVGHFEVDRDALAAAASLSPPFPSETLPVARVIEGLSVPAMRALLQRVAEGDGSRVMSELNRLTRPALATAPAPALRCREFADTTLKLRAARLKAEARAKAAAQQRETEERRQRLASVRQRADSIWAGLDPLMDQKTTAAYDQVAAQLQELQEAYAQTDETGQFRTRLAAFRERYARRTGLLRRIEKL